MDTNEHKIDDNRCIDDVTDNDRNPAPLEISAEKALPSEEIEGFTEQNELIAPQGSHYSTLSASKDAQKCTCLTPACILLFLLCLAYLQSKFAAEVKSVRAAYEYEMDCTRDYLRRQSRGDNMAFSSTLYGAKYKGLIDDLPQYSLVTSATRKDWKYMDFLLRSMVKFLDTRGVAEYVWIVPESDYKFFVEKAVPYRQLRNFVKIVIVKDENVSMRMHECTYKRKNQVRLSHLYLMKLAAAAAYTTADWAMIIDADCILIRPLRRENMFRSDQVLRKVATNTTNTTNTGAGNTLIGTRNDTAGNATTQNETYVTRFRACAHMEEPFVLGKGNAFNEREWPYQLERSVQVHYFRTTAQVLKIDPPYSYEEPVYGVTPTILSCALIKKMFQFFEIRFGPDYTFGNSLLHKRLISEYAAYQMIANMTNEFDEYHYYERDENGIAPSKGNECLYDAVGSFWFVEGWDLARLQKVIEEAKASPDVGPPFTVIQSTLPIDIEPYQHYIATQLGIE